MIRHALTTVELGQKLLLRGFAPAACARWSSALASSPRVSVLPSLKQRRPLVNGEAVAFHIKDLAKPQNFPYNEYEYESNRPQAPWKQPSWANSAKASRLYDSDLVVVLDMDECLIHSKFLSDPGTAQVYAHQVRRAAQAAQESAYHTATPQVDSFRVSLPDGDLVHVHVRPGLNDFLEHVCNKYETHIFTAAMDVYAKPVLDQLDPDGTKFAGRWYREHCQPQQGAYVKNLNNLPLANRLDRTVLVDNNPLSFLAQPSNGILVSNFYNDPTDTTLPAVLSMLGELDKAGDVRPLLEERFGLKEALADMESANTASA